jgi:hypothetical protein
MRAMMWKRMKIGGDEERGRLLTRREEISGLDGAV